MTERSNSPGVIPFLKWAGGKRWLTEKKPELFNGELTRYIEPFLGGGAAFCKVKPTEAIVSDANLRLIECYKAIKDNPQGIIQRLRQHHTRHCSDYFYETRASHFDERDDRAAQFIYLNRTCFNGLYRVNLKGRFNVPIGTKSSVELATDDFISWARLLQNVDIRCCDFEETISLATAGDLVYLDPPYTVKHNYNGFLKYNEKIFSWDDQVRLRDSAVQASNRGARVIISNAAHESVRNLYSGLGRTIVVERLSIIAANSMKRGSVEEILVVI